MCYASSFSNIITNRSWYHSKYLEEFNDNGKYLGKICILLLGFILLIYSCL